MEPQLVGIAGRKESGKSEVAKFLKEHHGFYRDKMAGGLKAMMALFLRWAAVEDPWYYIEGPGKEEPLQVLGGKTTRYAMQTLGTEWGRNCLWRDLWVNQNRQRLKTDLDYGIPVVIDDVRFGNERRMLQDLGATIIHVYRPGVVSEDGHASEDPLTPLPGEPTVLNGGSLEELQNAAMRALT